jgi:hypothetical protein
MGLPWTAEAAEHKQYWCERCKPQMHKGLLCREGPKPPPSKEEQRKEIKELLEMTEEDIKKMYDLPTVPPPDEWYKEAMEEAERMQKEREPVLKDLYKSAMPLDDIQDEHRQESC